MSSSSVQVTKRTTTVIDSGPKYSAKSYGDGRHTYRSGTGPRKTVYVTRSNPQERIMGGGGYSRTVSMSMGGGGLMAGPPATAYGNVSTQQVAGVKSSREREKKDMQDLNERFASYIEKVRFLEAQNKKLTDELARLKDRWGKETASIKVMYTTELEENRKLLDDAEKEKARLEIRCTSLEERLDENELKLAEAKDQIANQQEDLDRQNQMLAELETELNMLKKRIATYEDQAQRDKAEIKRLQDALNSARADLDAESLAHICAENRCQTLEEELEFLKEVHEQELKELAALAYRDTTAENREFWKNELGQALREIQTVYDEKLDAIRGELEGFYNLKIQEFRTGSTRQGMETSHAKEESKRLRTMLQDLRAKLADMESRNAQLEKELELLRREYDEKEQEWTTKESELCMEISKLRAELEAILKELQDLMDMKLGLELEIAAYRKLLEGEENRSSGFRGVIESIISSRGDEDDDSSMRMSQVVKGEMSAKTTYQRSAKGPITIHECAADGKYIILENTGRREENISGWKIKRSIDGSDDIEYEFLSGVVIKSGDEKKLKIYASGFRGSDKSAMECAIPTWGIGANITTKLINDKHEEKATHVQKTVYTS